MIYGPHQLSVFLGVSIIWLSLMIILILCGFFLCALNLTLFPHCKKIAFVSTQFGRTIKVVQSDNGHEFDNTSSHAFFASGGVVLWMSCSYTSPRNGKAERSLHTINNMLCSLLFQASMLARYWVRALHIATYLLNLLPVCRSLRRRTLIRALARFWLCLLSRPLRTSCSQIGPSVHSLCIPQILHQSQGLSVSRSLHQQHRHLSTCYFYEAVFPFAISPRLTNDLDIFL
jgi:hypothetical protein